MSEPVTPSNGVAVEDVPRQVRLAVAKVDPWSVMKISFLLSVGLAIIGVVATMVLWLMLDSMSVFSDIEKFLVSLGAEKATELLEYAKLSKVLSMSIIVGVMNVILLTALSTIASLLYNVCASLVGGVRVDLMDE